MKSLIFALALCACAPTASQAVAEVPQTSTDHPRYSDKEILCAQDTIIKLYSRAEQYGHDIFVFHIKSSDVWNQYLKCVIGH